MHSAKRIKAPHWFLTIKRALEERMLKYDESQLFPGCTLRTKAKELDRCARACAEILGFELCEIENWQCCGGVYVSAKDEIATKLAAVRATCCRTRCRKASCYGMFCMSQCYQANQSCHAERMRTLQKRMNLYLSQDKIRRSLSRRDGGSALLGACDTRQRI